MRLKLLLGVLILTVFAAGIYVGSEILHREKPIHLHLIFDRQAGLVTTYTFYRDASGAEVMHGDYREFTTDGRQDIRRRYQDGRLVDGVALIN